MPARKMPNITLARCAGPEQHDYHLVTRRQHFDAIRARIAAAKRGAPLVAEAIMARRIMAEKAVEQFARGVSSLGHRMPDIPTPERILQAMGEASVAYGLDHVVWYDERNEPHVETKPVIRTRVSDSTIEILGKRNLLSRDPERNALHLRVARRLHQDWVGSGLSAIGSIDFEKDVRKGTAPALFRSEHQLSAFLDYHAAMQALTSDERSIVHAIVIEELPVAMAGQKMLEYKGTSQAQAAALSVLRNALLRLGDHYERTDKRAENEQPLMQDA